MRPVCIHAVRAYSAERLREPTGGNGIGFDSMSPLRRVAHLLGIAVKPKAIVAIEQRSKGSSKHGRGGFTRWDDRATQA